MAREPAGRRQHAARRDRAQQPVMPGRRNAVGGAAAQAPAAPAASIGTQAPADPQGPPPRIAASGRTSPPEPTCKHDQGQRLRLAATGHQRRLVQVAQQERDEPRGDQPRARGRLAIGRRRRGRASGGRPAGSGRRSPAGPSLRSRPTPDRSTRRAGAAPAAQARARIGPSDAGTTRPSATSAEHQTPARRVRARGRSTPPPRAPAGPPRRAPRDRAGPAPRPPRDGPARRQASRRNRGRGPSVSSRVSKPEAARPRTPRPPRRSQAARRALVGPRYENERSSRHIRPCAPPAPARHQPNRPRGPRRHVGRQRRGEERQARHRDHPTAAPRRRGRRSASAAA